MSAIYNSTMSYSSKSYLDTLGSISLLNSIQISAPAPTPTTTATTLDVNNTDFSYYQDKVAYYKLHTKWWLKNKLGFSKQVPFEKKHLYGIAQKSL